MAASEETIMNKHLSFFPLALGLVGAVVLGGACSSDPGCVSNDAYLCAKDLGGFPFAQVATIVSDLRFGRQCAGIVPAAGATTMTMTHPEAGKLCLSGSIAQGGFAVLALEFPLKSLDETRVLQTFDAAGLGITQVALAVDSPPAQGADLLANAITHTECPMNPLDCQYPPNFKFANISTPGPVIAAFADFKSLDDPSQTLDTSLLDSVFLQVDSGAFDFCIHDFNFLDRAGNPVRP
jgi:hypothetical protein